MRGSFALGLLVACASLAMAKDGRTYYTDERIAVARENVRQYEWARDIEKRIIETGDPIKYYIGPTYT